MQEAGTVELPALRADLSLLEGAPAEDGAPTWLIHDISRNRYFRLGLEAFRALGLWQQGKSGQEFLQACKAAGVDIDEQDLTGLLQFMVTNQLTEVTSSTGLQRLLEQNQRARQHWLKWLLHHYLFVKIPLWRPDAFLNRTWPLVSRLLNQPLLWTMRGMGLLGLLMVLRQWDVFLSTFLHFLSLEGLALYGLTLLVVKSAHELGHAYVAKKYGCKVGSIGVAFLLLMPVLYTDTTDAWRLKSHRQRLRIVVAGVGTELHLAMVATFAWSLLPDGPWRSVAFFVATTSWVTSLLVNLSPFMRFDGYFALCDLWNAENLQPRSFALARWHLREMLFGLKEPEPEILPAVRARLFIAYAYATWIYRLVLFIGIAFLVYHFAFKLLGILLFVVEIGWFILLPMKNELNQWWQRRHKMKLNRQSLVALSVLLMLALVVLLPWRSTVTVPAVLLAGDFRPVYAPEPGRVIEVLVKPGDTVSAGTPLLRMEQPDLSHVAAQVARELSLVKEKMQRQVGSARDLQDALVLVQQRQELETKLSNLRQRTDRLTVSAPIAGKISQVDSLQVGQWVADKSMLMTLRAEEGLRVMALVSADDIHRIEEGAHATWVSSLPGSKRLRLNLQRIDQTALQVLPWPELASDFGGPVPARKTAQHQLRPEGAWYQLELASQGAELAPAQQQPGRVLVEAKRESLLGRYWRYAMAVWIRESGF